ncbi:225_t:CDS:1, partial [Ambispora gerdemannii]
FPFNSLWTNNSDTPGMGIFNPQQTAPDYPLKNRPIPQIPSHVFPGMIPPPMPSMGARRTNSGQVYSGPMPPEYINIRMPMMHPQMMGFPSQVPNPNIVYDVEKRPPKSSELFDPNNPSNTSTPPKYRLRR